MVKKEQTTVMTRHARIYPYSLRLTGRIDFKKKKKNPQGTTMIPRRTRGSAISDRNPICEPFQQNSATCEAT